MRYNIRRKRGMLQMSQYYEPEFKKKIVRLHLEEGRSLKGLAEEYGVSQAFLFGPNNSVKNAKQTTKPKPIMIT